MAAQAAVIFVGQVRSISRQEAHGYVDISFAVQQVLRGTSATVYVLREWAGLWTGQQDRYRLGERVLLLLRARSLSGFSSPIGGSDGAIPILGFSQPPLRNANGQVPADLGPPDPSELRADLRWIATRIERAPVSARGSIPPLPPSIQPGSDHPGVALSAVLSVLRAAPEDAWHGR